MKRIGDEVSLASKIENISMSELRSCPGEILTAVGLGKTYVIHKAGKPIAMLSKLPGQLCANVDSEGRITYAL